MAKDRKKLQHIHSSVPDKQPKPEALEVGEIAVNNGVDELTQEDRSFLSIKNSNDKITRFSSDEQLIDWIEKKEVVPYKAYVRGAEGPSSTSGDTPTSDGYGSYGINESDLLNNKSNIIFKINQVAADNTIEHEKINGANDVYGQSVNPSTDGGLTGGAGFFVDMSRYAMQGANPSFSSITVTHQSNLSGTTNIRNGAGGETLNIETTNVKAKNNNWNEEIANKTSNVTNLTETIGTANTIITSNTETIGTNISKITTNTETIGTNSTTISGNTVLNVSGTTTETKKGNVTETNLGDYNVNTSGKTNINTTSFNVSGDTNISGNTTVTGNTNVSGNAIISGNTNISGNTTTKGDNTVIGNNYVSGNTTIKGNTTISGETTIKNNLIVTGNTNVSGNTTTKGDNNVSGNTTVVGNSNVSGNTTIKGTATVDGATTLNGATTINNNLTVTGNTNVSGNTAIKGTTTVDGATTINDNLTVTGNTYVSGSTTVKENTYVSGNTEIKGATTLNGETTIKNNLTVTGNTNVSGNTTVKGDTIISGNTTVKGETKLDTVSANTISSNTISAVTLTVPTISSTSITVESIEIAEGGEITIPIDCTAISSDTVGDAFCEVFDRSKINVTSNGPASAESITYTITQDTNSWQINVPKDHIIKDVAVVYGTYNASTDTFVTCTTASSSCHWYIEMDFYTFDGSHSHKKVYMQADDLVVDIQKKNPTDNGTGADHNVAIDVWYDGKIMNVSASTTPNVHISGTLDVSGATTINNNLTVTGNSNVSGNTVIKGTATISGTTTLNGATTVNNNLTVTGNTTIKGNTNISGNTEIKGTTTLNGATTVNNNLTVTGNTNISGNTTTKGDNNVSGNTAIKGTATVDGATTLNGATTINNNLTVTGNTTLNAVSASSLSATTLKAENIEISGSVDIPVVSKDKNGLAPKTVTATSEVISTQGNEFVLTTTTGNTPTWRKLPATAFRNYYTSAMTQTANGNTVTLSAKTNHTDYTVTIPSATTGAAGVMTSTDKSNLDTLKPLTGNVSTLSGITDTNVTNWNTAYNNNHTHSNKTALDSITGSVGTMAYEDKSSYVATSRTISTASGLTGGGDLSANITLGLVATGTSGTYYRVVTDSYGRVISGNTVDDNSWRGVLVDGQPFLNGTPNGIPLGLSGGSNVTLSTDQSGAVTINAVDTKYSAGTASQISAGTSTYDGVWSAANLKSGIESFGYTKNTGTVTKVSTASGITGGDITTSGTIGLVATGTSGTYGPSADVTGNNGNTIKVPQITTDVYGRVTNVVERTYTSVDTQPNEDTWRPVKVNSSNFLTDKTNALDLVAGSNVTLTTGASGVVTISSTGGGTTGDGWRPVKVDGNNFLDGTTSSSSLNLSGGTNVTLTTGSTGLVTISSNGAYLPLSGGTVTGDTNIKGQFKVTGNTTMNGGLTVDGGVSSVSVSGSNVNIKATNGNVKIGSYGTGHEVSLNGYLIDTDSYATTLDAQEYIHLNSSGHTTIKSTKANYGDSELFFDGNTISGSVKGSSGGQFFMDTTYTKLFAEEELHLKGGLIDIDSYAETSQSGISGGTRMKFSGNTVTIQNFRKNATGVSGTSYLTLNEDVAELGAGNDYPFVAVKLKNYANEIALGDTMALRSNDNINIVSSTGGLKMSGDTIDLFNYKSHTDPDSHIRSYSATSFLHLDENVASFGARNDNPQTEVSVSNWSSEMRFPSNGGMLLTSNRNITLKATGDSNSKISISGVTVHNSDVYVSGTVYQTSDAVIKENITDVDYAEASKANEIPIKSFIFKGDESKTKKYGVIAQDVEDAGLNNLVSINDDIRNVDYNSLLILKIAYLENKIKELEKRLDDKFPNNG